MIQFKCSHCGHGIKVAEAFAGKKGKCPGCQKLVEVPKSSASSDIGLVPMDEDAAVKQAAPAAAQKKPVPAARPKPPAPPADDVIEVVEEVEEDVEVVEEEPPRKGKKRPVADDVEEDIEVVEEGPPRRKRRPTEDEEDEEEERPPKRPRRPARDEEEEEEDDRPRKGKKRIVAAEEEEDQPEEEEEERPRRRKKGRRGEWADCPECGCPGHAEKVRYTFWGGILAPKLFSIVECNKCGTRYNGKSGNHYTVGMIIYLVVAFLIIAAIFGLAAFIYISNIRVN